MAQLLCPYTTKLLAETSNVNNEHILPVALGVPQSFYVRATEEENSRMNDLIDAPASNDPILRFIAMAADVEGRSGAVRSEVKGKLEGSGDAVLASFTTGNVEVAKINAAASSMTSKTLVEFADELAARGGIPDGF